MKYSLEFTPAARRDFKRLTKDVQKRIDSLLKLLTENPRPPKVKRLQGEFRKYYRVRTGDFRIIYAIEDDRLVICVIRIGDRKEIYRKR